MLPIRRRSLRLLLWSSIGAAALPAACATHAREPAPSANDGVSLYVENQSARDFTIYVLRDAERIALGVALRGATSILPVPRRLVEAPTRLTVEAVPLEGAGQPVRVEVTVSPGQRMTLLIPGG